jgi:hypothetical protein
MGFHKRYISFETLLSSLKKNESLNRIFNAEALIFTDDLSEKIYQLYNQGLTNNEILNKLNNENN